MRCQRGRWVLRGILLFDGLVILEALVWFVLEYPDGRGRRGRLTSTECNNVNFVVDRLAGLNFSTKYTGLTVNYGDNLRGSFETVILCKALPIALERVHGHRNGHCGLTVESLEECLI